MMDDDLRAALGSVVERYGLAKVSRILREMETGATGPNGRKNTRRRKRLRSKGRLPAKSRRSAVDFVESVEVPPELAAVISRAADEFERRAFLPTLNDVRAFCEEYGIEAPRSRSRASGIPRIFKFLVTMNVADVERMLDDRVFSGPAELGPIADAIRDRAKEYRDAALDHT